MRRPAGEPVVTDGEGVRNVGLRKLALAVFFTSVAVNALLGLSALLVGSFSETHGRVLGTSLLVTAGLLAALACAPAWERRTLMPVPIVGAGASGLAVALGVVGIWTGSDSELLGKATGAATSIALGSVLASLLAFPTLEPRFRPVLRAAVGLDGLLVVMANITLWGEVDSTAFARAFGVVAVLLAASAVSIPVLARVRAPTEPPSGEAAVAFCPYCGGAATAHGADATCANCGRRFAVREV